MDRLHCLLEQFRDDENWNTENQDGTHRFDDRLSWIETMVNEYAEALGKSTDEVVDLLEKNRDCPWPYYYQEQNFPGLDSSNLYGVFDTYEDFVNTTRNNWKGFRCPRCGDITYHPQECIHRIEKDGKCDWCSFGLFRTGKGVIILEGGLAMIPIFEPVSKERM